MRVKVIETSVNLIMPFHRNFIYWIDKRKWKYVFLLTTLELSHTKWLLNRITERTSE